MREPRGGSVTVERSHRPALRFHSHPETPSSFGIHLHHARAFSALELFGRLSVEIYQREEVCRFLSLVGGGVGARSPRLGANEKFLKTRTESVSY